MATGSANAANKAGTVAFVKGQSGNPNGRPKIVDAFRDKARKAVDEHVLSAWIHEVGTMGEEWVRCSELLAAYGYGKPSQPVEHSGADGRSLDLVVRFVGPGDSK